MGTTRLTVGQAVVRFLPQQFTERDGREHRLIEGCFGIFGHGNIAGLGQALLESELQNPGALVYRQARNEQGMVHAAAAFARMRDRLSTLACTSSIGPGATNMVTGAALATINRLPVLLLPGDIFATRVADPVLQQLEHTGQRDALGERRLPPRVPFLRPCSPAGTAARCPSGCDARVERPGRDRCRHRLPPPGCPGRSLRLARRAFPAPGVARRPAGARPLCSRTGGRHNA